MSTITIGEVRQSIHLSYGSKPLSSLRITIATSHKN
jgi:hypothetical protein